MAQLNISQVSVEFFTHDKPTKRFIAEISDTGMRCFERLYNDACDVGFALLNPTSGNVTRWALSTTETDPEGDVLWWVFVPTPESVRANPKLEGYQLHLLND